MKALSRFDLYELVRDGTKVRGAQLALLNTVAWRANSAKRYSCFLSNELLVRETHYTEQNLRLAAKMLEDQGLIRRYKRSKRSTVFFLNVDKLRQMAAKAKRGWEQDEFLDELNPFEDVTPFEDETEGSDADSAEPSLTCESVEDVATLVGMVWQDHPGLKDRTFLMRDLETLVELTSGPRRCGELIYHLSEVNPKVCQNVANSDKLGLYLQKVLPALLTEYADVLTPIGEVDDYESGN